MVPDERRGRSGGRFVRCVKPGWRRGVATAGSLVTGCEAVAVKDSSKVEAVGDSVWAKEAEL